MYGFACIVYVETNEIGLLQFKAKNQLMSESHSEQQRNEAFICKHRRMHGLYAIPYEYMLQPPFDCSPLAPNSRDSKCS